MRTRSVSLALIVACVTIGWSTPTATARRAPLSLDLQSHKLRRPQVRTRVIVQGDNEKLMNLASRHKIRLVRTLGHEGVFEVNSAEMDRLAADGVVPNLSGDVPVQTTMTVSNKATAADKTRAGQGGLLGLLGTIPAVTGKNIGIAVVDSGISPHQALTGRVAYNISFVTGDSSTLDAFGHGTHIAGIIAGNGSAASGIASEFSGGIAPGAKLVNVRVLGANGTGLTSDVIAGINWVVDHRLEHNIRVMNLSLGHVVTESASTDPLCLAVKRAVENGIVVVASAGNRGKTEDGTQILGGITSPGNSPYAITVGALNTWATVTRSDDSVTTYSSRGPTRYDQAVKPDVVAPGNKIVSLEANGSWLSSNYPAFHVAGSGNNKYSKLSGTSMSAGVVTGGIALLLQGSTISSMPPARVKFTLQTGSSYLADGGLMAAGAGSVNFWPTRQVTYTSLLNTLLNLVGDLLSTSGGVSYWDAGQMSQRMYDGVGIRLLNLLDLPTLLINPSSLQWDTLNLAGENNSINLFARKRILYGDVSYWTQNEYIMWGDSIQDPEGNYIMWGDNQTTEGYYIMWGDTVGEGDPQ
jgi:serine protease AprX